MRELRSGPAAGAPSQGSRSLRVCLAAGFLLLLVCMAIIGPRTIAGTSRPVETQRIGDAPLGSVDATGDGSVDGAEYTPPLHVTHRL